MKFSLLLATLLVSPVLSVSAALAQMPKPDPKPELAPATAPAATPETAPATTPLPEAVVCTAGSSLNLRETPDGRVLASLPIGTKVQLVAPAAGDWQPVAYGEFRGYVWKAYLSSGSTCPGGSTGGGTTPTPEPLPPVGLVTPARCGANDPALRNIRYTGGLTVFDRPSTQGAQLARVNNGGVIRLDGTSTVDAQGMIWQPINHPAKGFILGGSNGVVNNIVYCTRFY